MKKPIISIIFILLFLGCSQENKQISRKKKTKENSEREYGGKVKKILEFECNEYRLNGTTYEIRRSSCKLKKTEEFAENEVVLLSKSWISNDENEEPDHLQYSKIDKSGNVIEVVSIGTGIFVYNTKTINSYNNDDFLTETVYFKDNKMQSREEFIYDKFNCIIKSIHYDENNNIKDYTEYEYDENNNEILKKQYSPDDNLIKQYKSNYDANGEKIKFIVTDNNGEIINEIDYLADKKNNKINYLYTDNIPEKGYADIEYYANGKVKKWHFINQNDNDIFQSYDENERIVERRIEDNGKWISTHTWKYREDGAVIEESESQSNIVGKTYYKTTTSFTVDFNGNWIEKYSVDSEGNVLELLIREIEYY